MNGNGSDVSTQLQINSTQIQSFLLSFFLSQTTSQGYLSHQSPILLFPLVHFSVIQSSHSLSLSLSHSHFHFHLLYVRFLYC